MAQSRVAGRYAKALLDLAKEKNSLDAVFNDMNLLRNTLSASSELSSIINNPVIGQSKKQGIFKALFEGKMNELSYGFLNLVIGKRREGDVDQIATKYVEQYNALNSVTDVTVTTAQPLTNEAETKLVEKLKSTSGLNKIHLTKQVDESIIGGYIVEFNNRILDNSIKSNLNQLKRRISQ